MLTAVDTNILIDVFSADKTFGETSAAILRESLNQGVLYACEIVWAETATAFANDKAFEKAMKELSIEYSYMGSKAALTAANAWRKYRKSGGKRTRVIADFLIAAHAQVHCDCLLTRDRGFYRKYFSGLRVVQP